MKFKSIILIAAAACLLSLTAACGTDKSSNTASESSAASEETSSTQPGKKLTLPGTAPKIVSIDPSKVKKYTHSNKAFVLKDYNTSVSMVNGWEIVKGGVASEQQCDFVTSYPAVLQYLDTRTTLTITLTDEREDKDSFLAGTEETYISAYSSEFDSIEITDFQQLSIDEYDSFKIRADVVIKGESFTMTHILTNDVSGKSISWMLLDSDGKFADFDLAEAIHYPKIIDTSKFERFEGKDLDRYYKLKRDD